MPPVFGPAIAVEDALVVLRGRHRHGASRRRTAPAARAPRPRAPPRPPRARRRSAPARGTPRAPRAPRASSCGDDHALARGQAVELEHDRVALDRRHPVLDGGDRAPRRGGTPAASMTSLANALEPSSWATSPRGPEGRDAARVEQVDQPVDQRRLGPDDDEVDGLALRPPRPCRPRRRRATSSRRASARDAGVARRAQHLGLLRRAPERADDRVLAPARADDEDLHAATELAMKSSTGIAASVS